MNTCAPDEPEVVAETECRICCQCTRWSFPASSKGACPGSPTTRMPCGHLECKRCGRGVIIDYREWRILKRPKPPVRC